jgi:hypothetical protein
LPISIAAVCSQLHRCDTSLMRSSLLGSLLGVLLVACSGDAQTPDDAAMPDDAPPAHADASQGEDAPADGPTDSMGEAIADAMPPADTFKLPWPMGTTMQLTQDCNDSCCNDHVGNARYAWDFANGSGFPIVASRGGTVSHLKINSTTGCGTSACVNQTNFIVIDHGDGTSATYLHLAGNSLAQNVSCGGQVTQGQLLAKAGTTGWSTGLHLHFQVGKTHNGAPTCECGANGQGCAANTVPWANFWSSTTYPTVTMSFVEWSAASMCANRRMTMPASQN